MMNLSWNYLSVLELDDLYYQLHQQGATLLELKEVRILQEQKIRETTCEDRKQLSRQIRERFLTTLVASSAKSMLGSV